MRMKRLRALAFAFFALVAPAAQAEPWPKTDPAAAGWRKDGFNDVEAYVAERKPTAFMVVQDGRVVREWGDVARPVNVYSVRKSMISALYGIADAEKKIDLDVTIGSLGIDDKPPSLTAKEKTARVRDLLTARSGIYHEAAYETNEMRGKRPARGSHAPDTNWYYNNWDFNALGTIYRQKAGEDIFESFQRRIAVPVGMEEFRPGAGRYVLEKPSDHPAYVFEMSARDAARVAQLYLQHGRWAGRQVVPEAWVNLTTARHSKTNRSDLGYGYLWWTLSPGQFGPGAALMSGFGGQIFAFVPSKRLVVAQTVDRRQNPEGIKLSEFVRLLGKIAAKAP